MAENWDEHAINWDRDDHVRFYADQAFASLIVHVNIQDDEWRTRRILDFGCGTGLLSERLAPLVADVVAIDTSQSMIEVLDRKEIGNVTTICADIDDPAVRIDATWFSEFDLVVASSVCGFLPDYEATLGVLAQPLNEGGFFAQWDWLAPDDEPGMTVSRIAHAFDAVDLIPVHIGQAFSVTFDGDEMPVVMGVARHRR